MIPSWNMAGIIPPIRPGVGGGNPDRSPYKVGFISIIERFGISPERVKILNGLVTFR